MVDLSKPAALPLVVNSEGALEFPDSIGVEESLSRNVRDLTPFLIADPVNVPETPLYKVYKGVAEMESANAIERSGLRYDITILLSGSIALADGAQEYIRTAGHYHDMSKNGIGWPEIYEVLSGFGRWLIQKPGPDPLAIEAAYLVEAGVGEKICIPPGFGHITINAESSVLVEANINSGSFAYDYEPYRRARGGCYRFLNPKESGMIQIDPNPSFSNLPPLKKLKPKKDWFKGYFTPLWNIIRDHPEDVKFLLNPETCRKEFFAVENLYQEIS